MAYDAFAVYFQCHPRESGGPGQLTRRSLLTPAPLEYGNVASPRVKLMVREYYVYILASRRNGTLYFGITNDLARRVFEHREGMGARFAQRYGVKLLVYFESYPDVRDAIAREKMLKKWRRDWKLQLIEANNPQWRDLYESL